MADHEEPENTIEKDIVVTKYRMAGDIVNEVMKKVSEKCVAGTKVIDICKYGDDLLNEETGKVFKKEKEIKKGIAFPCCVSVNNCICHFSPLEHEVETKDVGLARDVELKDGDLVKIDLGAHIDGFPAMIAHTLVVGASPQNKVTGRKADVVLAAYKTAEVALRLVKATAENTSVSEAITKTAEQFECKPVEGMISHQLHQHVIDGDKKTITQNPNEAQKKDLETVTFDTHEVYAVDVLISTGQGKPREIGTRTTVYKRNPDSNYSLKMKTSKQVLSDMEKKHGSMAFCIRGTAEEEKNRKLGVIECVKYTLMDDFKVLYEREGEYVAQFKFTLLLMPTGSMKITGLPVDTELYQSDKTIKDEEILNILSQSANRKAAKKKKKKAEKAMQESAAPPQAVQS